MKNIFNSVVCLAALCCFADASATVACTANQKTGDSALFVSQSVPDSMQNGNQYYVSVTFCNNGTTTWNYQAPPSGGNYTGYYRLGSLYPHDNTTWGINRVDLSSGDSIAPGSTKTFYFTVTAPSTLVGGNQKSAVSSPFQFGMLKEGVTWFGYGANETVTSFYTPAITVQNVPQVAPVAVGTNGPSAFSFANFPGANALNHTYVQAGNVHTQWIPNSSQIATIAATATGMNLKYLRIPLIIPPNTSNSEFVSSEWWSTNNATNVSNVISAIQTVLNTANSYGLKVILNLGGYTEYDNACNADGLWEKSFDSVKTNAATIIQAVSSYPALYAWDLLNEPLWNAYAFGCLDAYPNSFDQSTQSPQLSLSGTAQLQSITEVVEAVHAMYNVVRANDSYNHPTTVGEGTSAYVHYWSDISSFASPHIYVVPQNVINDQVNANNNNDSTLGAGSNFMGFTGAPTNSSTWSMNDTVFQSQVPAITAADIQAMEQQAIGADSVPLPLIVGEYGLGYTSSATPPTQTDQSTFFSLSLSALQNTGQSVYSSVNIGGLFWSLQSTPPSTANFSLMTSSGTLVPAGCTVAKQYGATPTGC